ncbi:hypothetical protein [Arthrobacter silvisoli]|uniref:hypothetical protein n=1 Tax=Arthrobacter silvisoli TaxID=2291022 RepID=UPI00109BE5D7|nr:hypothetical protein [Arthrobacter silvisoli]
MDVVDKILPAAAGLLGVALGGGIQLLLAQRLARREDARETRKAVAAFRHAVHLYLRFVRSLALHPKEDEVAGKELGSRYRAGVAAAHELVALPNGAVAQMGVAALGLLDQYAEEIEGITSGRKGPWAEPTELNAILDELLEMVAVEQ